MHLRMTNSMRGIHKSQSEESTSTILIETKYGTLRGLTKDGTQVFKGISYGRNTGGLARFTPPREPEPWFGVKDAIEFGAPAVQNTAQRSRMFHWLQTTQKGSEDCLVLNVFAPLEVRNQPVL